MGAGEVHDPKRDPFPGPKSGNLTVPLFPPNRFPFPEFSLALGEAADRTLFGTGSQPGGILFLSDLPSHEADAISGYLLYSPGLAPEQGIPVNDCGREVIFKPIEEKSLPWVPSISQAVS